MGQVVARVHRAGLAFEGFTRAQLSRYEAGLVSLPDPAVLWRIAMMYGTVTVHELVELLAEDRERLAEQRAKAPPPLEARAVKGRKRASS